MNNELKQRKPYIYDEENEDIDIDYIIWKRELLNNDIDVESFSGWWFDNRVDIDEE